MEARGWRYDAEFGVGCFWAGRGLDDERGALNARAFPSGEGDWHASYGVPGQDFSAYQHYPAPMAAAVAAEAWLREEIARFGFPWLAGVQGTSLAPLPEPPDSTGSWASHPVPVAHDFHAQRLQCA